MINKKKPCKECNTLTYGRLCNKCEAKKRIARSKELAKKKKLATPKPKKTEAIRPKKKKKARSPRVTTIKKHCYDIYSLFIRMRDSDEQGIGTCITCPRQCFFYDNCADNGHGFSRKHMATAFHPQNNNLQCKGCNGPGNGMQYDYCIAVSNKFGKGTAEKLSALSKTTKQYKFLDYCDLIRETLPICYNLLSQKKIDQAIKDKITERLNFYKRYTDKIINLQKE